MRMCKNCAHCIFNETWGEYKCKKKQVVCFVGEARKCKFYEKASKAGITASTVNERR